MTALYESLTSRRSKLFSINLKKEVAIYQEDMPMTKSLNKKYSRKKIDSHIWSNDDWSVRSGRLIPGPGRPNKAANLFDLVGEKLPYGSLPDVRKALEAGGQIIRGVYLAHDSMGYARYGGRGIIFDRLAAHKRKYNLELVYYSFYRVANKKHEREIETLILRAAGPQMVLNQRKTATAFEPGNLLDYEPGTAFFERG